MLFALALLLSSMALGSPLPWAVHAPVAAQPQPLAAPDCAAHPARTPLECGCDKITAPPHYNLTFTTSAGDFTVQVERAVAPIGADRLYAMSKCGDYLGASHEKGNEGGFFRVVPGFVVQWGISGLPAVSQAWESLVLPNEAKPSSLSNVRGTLAYAAEQDASGMACNRTTQIFVNFGDNSRLDALGFSVIGKIAEADMAGVVDKLNAKWGEQPDQDQIYAQGNAYLQKSFPGLSYALSTHL